jgi:hypothetical protein
VAEPRDPEVVRRDIARERQQLADAVENLRIQLGSSFDLRQKLGSRLAIATPAAFAAGFVVSGGIGATMRYFARRGRES